MTVRPPVRVMPPVTEIPLETVMPPVTERVETERALAERVPVNVDVPVTVRPEVTDSVASEVVPDTVRPLWAVTAPVTLRVDAKVTAAVGTLRAPLTVRVGTVKALLTVMDGTLMAFVTVSALTATVPRETGPVKVAPPVVTDRVGNVAEAVEVMVGAMKDGAVSAPVKVTVGALKVIEEGALSEMAFALERVMAPVDTSDNVDGVDRAMAPADERSIVAPELSVMPDAPVEDSVTAEPVTVMVDPDVMEAAPSALMLIESDTDAMLRPPAVWKDNDPPVTDMAPVDDMPITPVVPKVMPELPADSDNDEPPVTARDVAADRAIAAPALMVSDPDVDDSVAVLAEVIVSVLAVLMVRPPVTLRPRAPADRMVIPPLPLDSVSAVAPDRVNAPAVLWVMAPALLSVIVDDPDESAMEPVDVRVIVGDVPEVPEVRVSAVGLLRVNEVGALTVTEEPERVRAPVEDRAIAPAVLKVAPLLPALSAMDEPPVTKRAAPALSDMEVPAFWVSAPAV